MRSSAMLISPWVGAGVVFQEPKGPTNTSQFELSSVPATVRNLFNLSGFLTKRDAWAGSFDELLLDSPRMDAPMHFPDAPPPAAPWDPAPSIGGGNSNAENTGDEGFSRQWLGEGVGGGEPQPQHCGQKEQVCRGIEHVTVKQQRTIQLLAKLTKTPEPDTSAMSNAEANLWLQTHWGKWMAQDVIEHPLERDGE